MQGESRKAPGALRLAGVFRWRKNSPPGRQRSQWSQNQAVLYDYPKAAIDWPQKIRKSPNASPSPRPVRRGPGRGVVDRFRSSHFAFPFVLLMCLLRLFVAISSVGFKSRISSRTLLTKRTVAGNDGLTLSRSRIGWVWK